jgi:hypothetical protein
VRDEHLTPPDNPFAGVAAALWLGIVALWRSLTAPPTQRVAAQPSAGATREPQL